MHFRCSPGKYFLQLNHNTDIYHFSCGKCCFLRCFEQKIVKCSYLFWSTYRLILDYMQFFEVIPITSFSPPFFFSSPPFFYTNDHVLWTLCCDHLRSYRRIADYPLKSGIQCRFVIKRGHNLWHDQVEWVGCRKYCFWDIGKNSVQIPLFYIVFSIDKFVITL